MTSRRRADDIGHELAMRLRAAYAHLRRHTNLALAPFNMTADQFVLLTVLARSGEATQQELVRQCFSDSATIGTMLALLEKKRLVIREPHARDGRATTVKLSAAGRRLAERMRRGSAELRVKLASLFREREVKMMVQLLERVASALQPPARKSGKPRKSPPANADNAPNRRLKKTKGGRRTRSPAA